jgi:hypothetical protein
VLLLSIPYIVAEYLPYIFVKCTIGVTNFPQLGFHALLSDSTRDVRFERVTAGKKAEKPVGRGGVARANPPAVEQLARDEQGGRSKPLIGPLEFSATLALSFAVYWHLGSVCGTRDQPCESSSGTFASRF